MAKAFAFRAFGTEATRFNRLLAANVFKLNHYFRIDSIDLVIWPPPGSFFAGGLVLRSQRSLPCARLPGNAFGL